MTAYYNEHDPFAAAWLRELIADGLIAPGEVDERSIEDVRPDELAGFVQCHFFAGIGVWSLALRQAGVPDDYPLWTGSCPCQPFSAAGKGAGFADERHLWPAFHWLIEQCAPELVLGEQVASKDGLAWLDLVSADVEASGYAFGAVDTCAAGFGAPHIRQRLYWMADAGRERRHRQPIRLLPGRQDETDPQAAGERSTDRLADTLCSGAGHAPGQGLGAQAAAVGSDGNLPRERLRSGIEGQPGGVGDAGRGLLERQQRPDDDTGPPGSPEGEARQLQWGGDGDRHSSAADGKRPGPLNGLWRDADWLCCTDGKWRPVAPGTFPLAPAGTVRNRVGTLRGAGNAINLAQAQGFIEAVMAVRAQSERLAA
jgi:DNA (cytosine-5)-methyltransferase 1